ncbi:MAG: sugar ABC transporter permease [Clostridia bacterium]|nr:sugar ABC transporter permease [Clostridia bacterium]
MRTIRANHRRQYFQRMKSSWQQYTLILPAIAAVFLFHYIPIYGVQIAFKDFRNLIGIRGSEWIGLNHFQKFIEYPMFWSILKNTVVISLYSIATFPCSLIFALMINELKNGMFKNTVQMLTYAPHFVSTVVVASMVMLFLNRESGVINHVLSAFGAQRQDFMGVPEYFSSIYVWSGVWQELGWGTIIYLAALSSISPEMIESAKIDGASRLKIVRYINLPSIMPTVITLLILRTGSLLSVGFEKTYLLQNSLNISSSRVISTYVYEVGLLNTQYSYSSAIGLFNNVINIAFILIVNGISKRVTQVGLW